MHDNISLGFIEHLNSFILVQEQKFYDESNQSYNFFNILQNYQLCMMIQPSLFQQGRLCCLRQPQYRP